ncbi:hypothetical protein RYD26_12350 [Pasteurellaceae bacterium LIM206]|nr:hypothetical protein [Pasteurellaceae bacterium LIM206]
MVTKIRDPLNNVKNSNLGNVGTDWRGDPRNIDFLQNGNHLSGFNEHLHGSTGHSGSYSNNTTGQLIDREATLANRLNQNQSKY